MDDLLQFYHLKCVLLNLPSVLSIKPILFYARPISSFGNKASFSLILCCNFTSCLSIHFLEFIGLTSHWPFAIVRCLFQAFLTSQFGTSINVLQHLTIDI